MSLDHELSLSSLLILTEIREETPMPRQKFLELLRRALQTVGRSTSMERESEGNCARPAACFSPGLFRAWLRRRSLTDENQLARAIHNASANSWIGDQDFGGKVTIMRSSRSYRFKRVPVALAMQCSFAKLKGRVGSDLTWK